MSITHGVLASLSSSPLNMEVKCCCLPLSVKKKSCQLYVTSLINIISYASCRQKISWRMKFCVGSWTTNSALLANSLALHRAQLNSVAQGSQANLAQQALQEGLFFFTTPKAISPIIPPGTHHSEKLTKEMASLKEIFLLKKPFFPINLSLFRCFLDYRSLKFLKCYIDM